jgi:hypothetical protein
LDSLSLEECKDSFIQHKINGVALIELTGTVWQSVSSQFEEEDFKNELLLPLGPRKQIMKALREHKTV